MKHLGFDISKTEWRKDFQIQEFCSWRSFWLFCQWFWCCWSFTYWFDVDRCARKEQEDDVEEIDHVINQTKHYKIESIDVTKPLKAGWWANVSYPMMSSAKRYFHSSATETATSTKMLTVYPGNNLLQQSTWKLLLRRSRVVHRASPLPWNAPFVWKSFLRVRLFHSQRTQHVLMCSIINVSKSGCVRSFVFVHTQEAGIEWSLHWRCHLVFVFFFGSPPYKLPFLPNDLYAHRFDSWEESQSRDFGSAYDAVSQRASAKGCNNSVLWKCWLDFVALRNTLYGTWTRTNHGTHWHITSQSADTGHSTRS